MYVADPPRPDAASRTETIFGKVLYFEQLACVLWHHGKCQIQSVQGSIRELIFLNIGLGGSGIEKNGGGGRGWQQRLAAFCDVRLRSG